MISNFIVFICFVVICNTCQTHGADDLIVQLPEGKIRGHVLESQNKAEFYAFQEIPYAAPPVGKNRLLPPKDPLPWDGILNVTENTKMCSQILPPSALPKQDVTKATATEDCLYLNVYTPVKPGTEEKMPVFLWIHGGALQSGSGSLDDFGPYYLMDYGMIVVTINYRLGSLGFLSTLDGVLTGNLGLKDQRKALRWVNSHIGLFGGDPEQVTIAGESAGALSTSFHLLSENSEGLFRGVIQESGSALITSTYQKHALYYAYELGTYLDASFGAQNSSTELLNLVQSVSYDDFIAAAQKVDMLEISTTGYVGDILWGAVVEGNTDDPFISSPMHESFMNGNFHKVPTLLGMNSEEAISFIVWSRNSSWYLAGEYDKNISRIITDRLNIPTEQVPAAAADLKKAYTDTSFSENLGAFIKISSDSGFTNGILRQAELSYKHVPTYLYIFSYEANVSSSMYEPNGRPDIPGVGRVGHAEELNLIWKMGDIVTESDLLTQKRILTMWSNFVKYLNPTPKQDDLLTVVWPAVQDQDLQYLNINEPLGVGSSPRNYKQVSSVIQKYIAPPYVIF